MRLIDPVALAQIQSGAVKMALLVEMIMSAPVLLNSTGGTLVYAGNTYVGTGVLGGVGEIDDSPGEYKNLTLQLSGVDQNIIAIALAEEISNKRLTVRQAFLHPDNNTVLDAPIIWTGIMDQMPIEQGDKSASVSVSAEHRGLILQRPKPINYNYEDQILIDPTDTCLRFVQSQSTHQDVWPAASFFKQ